jgi:hypothetical protein
MPRGKQSKGQCTYCQTEIVKNVVTKHLATCPQRQAIIQQAEKKKGKTETLFHLRAQPAHSKEFWIDIEMRGSKTLQDLDSYLRSIWLECCGHLSEFSIGAWTEDKFEMDERIADVFSQATTVTHIYDFGTTSETNISLIGTREGHPTTSHPLALMVRNLIPETKCLECEQPATQFCMECMIEDDQWGALCDAHAEDHPHDNYGEPIPLVNSPRLGMCGYEGPAEAPY